MKKFLEIVSGNDELRTKVNSMDKDSIITAARDLGLALNAADFEQPTGELDDDELETVAGGERICACAMGGGGKASEKYDLPPCACVAAGVGRGTGDGTTCICPLAGYGNWVNIS